MAKTKLSPEFEIEIGGEPYVWRLRRRPQWSTDTNSWQGMAIAVRHAEGQREAVIEFPPAPPPPFGAPQMKVSDISVELVATAIASAIEAGWEPLSRGKTVSIVVDAMGG